MDKVTLRSIAVNDPHKVLELSRAHSLMMLMAAASVRFLRNSYSLYWIASRVPV